MVADVSSEGFGRVVLASGGLTVVDFYAPDSALCAAFAPALEDLAAAYRKRVNFVRVNVDQNKDLCRCCGTNVCDVVIFENGVGIERLTRPSDPDQARTKVAALIESRLPAARAEDDCGDGSCRVDA
jgi:thioredoxin-like negative regulator of GroEL